MVEGALGVARNPGAVRAEPPLLRSTSVVAPESIRAGVRHEIEFLGRTSLVVSICLFVQAVVGGGLLTYPYAYKTGGILNMLALQMMMLVFIAPGLWILAVCTERTGADTYQSVLKHLLGRKAEVSCEILVVILIFGASVTYLDIFVDQVHPWVAQAALQCEAQAVDHTFLCTLARLLASRAVFTLLSAAIISFLCLGRTIASLSIPSLFGFGALLYVCIIIMANFAAGAQHGLGPNQVDSAHRSPMWVRTSMEDWLSMLPVICFSYQGHISAVPLYAELKRRSMRRWFVVISVGLTVCVLLYNATGLLGYLQFLDGTQSDVLKCFVTDQYTPNIPMALVAVARVATAMAVSVTSAVFTFCARSALLDEVSLLRGPAAGPLPYPLFLLITYVWVASVAIAAICFPDIGMVVSFVGNVCAFFMFQFPGMCLIALARADGGCEGGDDGGTGQEAPCWQVSSFSSKQRRQVATGWLFIAVGTLVFCSGMYNALQKLV